jgi:carboxymethylenebutenolidase
VAIAPALFDRVERGVELGYEADDIEIGRGIARGGKLDNDLSLQDVRAAAVAVAGASPNGKVGVVGYCWGGLLVARSAIESPDVFAAAVAYYGGGTPALADQQPTVPMMMHFGEHDHAIPLADVDVLRAAWPHVTFHIYDAQHGFNCDHRGSYDAAAAELALERTLAFFAAHLAG